MLHRGAGIAAGGSSLVMDRETRQGPRVNAPALVEELRYWVPSIKDVALVQESEDAYGLRLYLIPAVQGACPVELLLRNDGLFDIEIGGVLHEGQELSARRALIQLLDAITSGRVVQRCFSTAATAVPAGIETVVTFQDGTVWCAGVRRGNAVGDAIAARDRHFLPYRRA